jgi:hypothetical protein
MAIHMLRYDANMQQVPILPFILHDDILPCFVDLITLLQFGRIPHKKTGCNKVFLEIVLPIECQFRLGLELVVCNDDCFVCSRRVENERKSSEMPAQCPLRRMPHKTTSKMMCCSLLASSSGIGMRMCQDWNHTFHQGQL